MSSPWSLWPGWPLAWFITGPGGCTSLPVCHRFIHFSSVTFKPRLAAPSCKECLAGPFIFVDTLLLDDVGPDQQVMAPLGLKHRGGV